MVLAAGAGRRLESLTEDLPKTLLPVDGDRTILDIALGNLRRAGMETVVVVTGYAAERPADRSRERAVVAVGVEHAAAVDGGRSGGGDRGGAHDPSDRAVRPART